MRRGGLNSQLRETCGGQCEQCVGPDRRGFRLEPGQDRRVRRQLEGLALPDIAGCDLDLWHEELRALATAVALDRKGGDLRAALEALIGDERPESQPGPDADLCPLVAASPSARALLARVVATWCERITREI
jgi:hypothetical protein